MPRPVVNFNLAIDQHAAPFCTARITVARVRRLEEDEALRRLTSPRLLEALGELAS